MRCLIVLFIVQTADAAARVMPLQKLIEIGLERSPDVRQVLRQYESSRAKSWLALAPADPTVSVTYNDMASRYHLNTTASLVYQITQPIGFPGRALLNHSALDKQSEAIFQLLKSMRLQVSTNIKQAYYSLALAQKNIQLNRDQRYSYQRILEIAQRRYETGVASQVDYLNAQLQLLQNENDLTDLESAERNARSQLNVLLQEEPLAPIDIQPIVMVMRPPVSIEAALNVMVQNRPEIRAARSQLAAANKQYDLAWMTLLPDFQITAGTTFYRLPQASPLAGGSEPSQHTFMFGFQLNVPLWFLFNEREVILGASHDRAAADANVDVVLEQSKNTLTNAVEAINALRVKIDNYEKHMLPMAEQSLKMALISYSAGKIDFQTLSDTATARRGIRQAYITAMVSYFNNYATYGQLIGEDL